MNLKRAVKEESLLKKNMKKVIISVLGKDRPGIIAAVTKILFKWDCNVENVSQTILQSEFSGIFIVSIPKKLNPEHLQDHLRDGMSEMNLHVHVKTLKNSGPDSDYSGLYEASEPFVITTRGPDRKGLVATLTEILASYDVNVTNLQAVFKGGDDPDKNIMIYEVDVPSRADQKSLSAKLKDKAKNLGLELRIQHRNIFEAMNRI